MLLTKSQLTKATEKDLTQAAEAIKAEIIRRSSNTKAELLREMKKMAAKAGVSLESILGKTTKPVEAKAPRAKKVAGKPKKKVAPKYANPANTSQTWTGRGRQPLWVANALNSGLTMDALLIK